MKVLSFKSADFREWRAAMNRTATPDPRVTEIVSAIIAEVCAKGDEAVLQYTRQFDRTDLSAIQLVATPAKPPARVVDALQKAHDNILSFSERRLPKDWRARNAEGAWVGEQFRPFDRIGIYVPGGSAPLVSTALMTVTLAAAAGCREIAVATPPPINPALHFAMHMAGATEILQMGGAQAVAALAYGTGSIRAVQKIFGPGNPYVVEAKRQVVGAVAIDQLPGPSEAMVIADGDADPRFVASDLLAQAEHGPDSTAVLLTPRLSIRDAVHAEIGRILRDLSRREILEQSLRNGCALVHCRNIAEALAIANDYAPEHLSLQVDKPRTLLPKIHCAGAIFLGGFSPIVVGDFVAGPSHTLPTGGAAKSFSGLTVDQFFRRSSVIEYTRAALTKILPAIATFAEIEELDAHGFSAAVRLAKVERKVLPQQQPQFQQGQQTRPRPNSNVEAQRPSVRQHRPHLHPADPQSQGIQGQSKEGEKRRNKGKNGQGP